MPTFTPARNCAAESPVFVPDVDHGHGGGEGCGDAFGGVLECEASAGCLSQLGGGEEICFGVGLEVGDVFAGDEDGEEAGEPGRIESCPNDLAVVGRGHGRGHCRRQVACEGGYAWDRFDQDGAGEPVGAGAEHEFGVRAGQGQAVVGVQLVA
ncbi:hypothetical protein OG520_40070 (plasmid) [Streptomyces sp. NBC_00984]|nr:hypothetical protein OG520_40070 [Streptomyces sp. NBC_00984]